MRALVGLLLAIWPALAFAQTPDPAPPPAATGDAWLSRPVADLQALDKITARVTSLSIKTGQSATFGTLTISVRFCMVRPPDVAADTSMFLDIVDQTSGAPQFHGWMLVSAPAANLLQHPVYDIRPSACHA